MVETYRYFDLEVDVQRVGEGGVRWFMTYYFDDELERAEFRGIIKQENGLFVYKDSQTADVFNPKTQRARGFVRGHDGGVAQYSGQVAWATDLYHGFLRYYARARFSNTLADQLRWGVQRLDAAGLARFKRLILSFEGGLKELSRETQERFDPNSDDSYVFLWHLIQAMKGSKRAREVVDGLYPKVSERWRWSRYGNFLELIVT